MAASTCPGACWLTQALDVYTLADNAALVSAGNVLSLHGANYLVMTSSPGDVLVCSATTLSLGAASTLTGSSPLLSLTGSASVAVTAAAGPHSLAALLGEATLTAAAGGVYAAAPRVTVRVFGSTSISVTTPGALDLRSTACGESVTSEGAASPLLLPATGGGAVSLIASKPAGDPASAQDGGITIEAPCAGVSIYGAQSLSLLTGGTAQTISSGNLVSTGLSNALGAGSFVATAPGY